MSYTKSFRPYISLYIPKYVRQKYPKWIAFIDELLIYIEKKNGLKWYEGDLSGQQLNSLYQNIVNFRKNYYIEELPVENEDLFNAYIDDYAKTLDYRSIFLKFEDEVYRNYVGKAKWIFQSKDSWRTFNLIFAFLHHHFVNDVANIANFSAFYQKQSTDFTTETDKDFYYEIVVDSLIDIYYGQEVIGVTSGAYGIVRGVDVDTNTVFLDNVTDDFNNTEVLNDYATSSAIANITSRNSVLSNVLNDFDIVLTDVPHYYLVIDLSAGLRMEKLPIDNTDKGAHPFYYQIISKNKIFDSGDFIQKLKESSHPAGFWLDFIIITKPVLVDIITDSVTAPKISNTIETLKSFEGVILAPSEGDVLIAGKDYLVNGTTGVSAVDICSINSVGDFTVEYDNLAVSYALFMWNGLNFAKEDYEDGENVTIRVRDHNDPSVYLEVGIVIEQPDPISTAIEGGVSLNTSMGAMKSLVNNEYTDRARRTEKFINTGII